MNGFATTMAAFLAETNGTGTPERLRAVLLDSATSGRGSTRNEIEAVVAAYERGVRRTEPARWAALHADVADVTDTTSASVALDAWAETLGVDWRPSNQSAAEESPAAVGRELKEPVLAASRTQTGSTRTQDSRPKLAAREQIGSVLIALGIIGVIGLFVMSFAGVEDGSPSPYVMVMIGSAVAGGAGYFLRD